MSSFEIPDGQSLLRRSSSVSFSTRQPLEEKEKVISYLDVDLLHGELEFSYLMILPMGKQPEYIIDITKVYRMKEISKDERKGSKVYDVIVNSEKCSLVLAEEVEESCVSEILIVDTARRRYVVCVEIDRVMGGYSDDFFKLAMRLDCLPSDHSGYIDLDIACKEILFAKFVYE
ncbi:MAG: hypothetical protein Harvfovirus68_2 [Harvfovirus sp.]|uniref:Uncharacterized protein n=1 Tax=Harvfovirus sp. TaxID=2487768 RepID=A0A3G5A6H9_9VIRU|nr:MAG: hypothetical protein Harvfovirus68_2 [Harvfovirus sp.]